MTVGRIFPVIAVLLVGMALGGGAAVGVGKQPRIDESKLLDLTYDFDSSTIYWPGLQAASPAGIQPGPPQQAL